MIQLKKAFVGCGFNMRVGIIGSRNCENFDISIMEQYLPDDCDMIISGGADGIDTYAETLAGMKGIPFMKLLPDYKAYGKKAPLERNLLIVKNSDILLVFWDCYSRGTAHTINACIKGQKPVRIIPLENI